MDLTQLLGTLKHACDSQSGGPELQLGYGAALLQAGKSDQAIEQYSAAIHADPQNADGYLHRGVAYSQAGETELAIKDFDTAIAIGPASNVAYLRRAVSLSEVGRLDSALLDFDHALQIENTFDGKPADLERLVRETRLALGSKLTGKSPEIAEEIFDPLKPNVSDEEMLVVFHSFAESEETERALAFYFDCQDLVPTYSPEHLAHYGSLSSAAGYRAEAIQILEDTRASFPQHSKTLLELGWAYFLENDFQQAEQILRQAINVDPTNAHAYCSLAWVLSSDELSKSKGEDALQLARTMQNLAGYPEDRKLKVLARCQLRLGQTEEARTTLQQAISIASEDQLAVLQQMMPL